MTEHPDEVARQLAELDAVRRLAEHAGGTVELSPRAGGGVTATLRLPAAREDAR